MENKSVNFFQRKIKVVLIYIGKDINIPIFFFLVARIHLIKWISGVCWFEPRPLRIIMHCPTNWAMLTGPPFSNLESDHLWEKHETLSSVYIILLEWSNVFYFVQDNKYSFNTTLMFITFFIVKKPENVFFFTRTWECCCLFLLADDKHSLINSPKLNKIIRKTMWILRWWFN